MDALLHANGVVQPVKLSIGKNVYIKTDALTSTTRTLTSLENDLLSLGSIIYAADLAVKRNEREDFVRTIRLQLPVVNLAAFQGVKAQLEQILRVLSCDNWSLDFIAATGVPEANQNWPETTGTTLLFSGGLDSFAGACDLLQRGQQTFLVSHTTHNRPVAASQTQLVAAIEGHFGTQLSHTAILVHCRNKQGFPFPQDAHREETQRTRSFLFVVLATVAARVNGSRRVLVMAENGQFAIHLPLTAARVGAFSTHTAHPEFLDSMQAALRQLLLCPDLTLTNPFVHKTKAEVVERIPKALHPAIEKSISCWMTARLSDYTHCGECVPCLSRRFALEEHGLWFDEYKRDLFKENIGNLPPDDNGKRNLVDLLEFIGYFHGPNAITDDSDLCLQFPELFNPYIDRSKTISMYRRFAKSSSKIVKRFPGVRRLLR